MPHHHLLTLGAPLLLSEAGEQIRFRTRKHLALLVRLAVEAGKKFTRDYLVDLLWPDAPARLANHSLAQALSVLKAKVGREHVLIQKATVALADGVVHADVRRLDASEVEIRGPFLDGFEIPGAPSFEQWKDEWRARLMPQLRDCLVRQMDAARRTGDFATVEKHAQVLLDLDPLSEDAVRGIMEARAWVGDRTNALKAFARFAAQLGEELGAKPSADLVRIAELLRAGRRAPPRPLGEGASEARVAEPRVRRFEAEPLVGREREFSVLYDAWLEARRRTPRIIVLSGDPGVGKTTLTNAFLSTCQMEGAVIARAQAYDAERELPFAVLAELVKQLAVQRAIGGADPEELAELSRISSEIGRAFPGVPRPPDWPAEVVPLRLAEAFLRTIEAAAEENPVVLVVDDVHASDNASAAILHVVARKLPLARLLVILAGRSAELRVSGAPAALVSDTTVEALRVLELTPLTTEQAEQLVARLASGADDERGELPTARILQASSGNPLAIELLTKEWLEHGSQSLLRDLEALNTQPAATIGIPRAIGTVFERQVRRLDAQTRAALDLAAVLGHRLSDLSLYEAVDLTSSQAGEALSRLSEEGLLREVHGDLEFKNELIRAHAYYTIAGKARQHLHRAVANLLAAQVRRDDHSLNLHIAWHYLRALEPNQATPYAIEGARASLYVGAPLEAEEILTALLRESQDTDSRQRLQFLLVRALLGQSKAETAIPLLRALQAEGCLGPRANAEATRMEAWAEYLLNRETGDEYRKAAAAALETARRTGDAELIVRALFEYARAGMEAGDHKWLASARHEIGDLLHHQSVSDLAAAHFTKGFCDFYSYDATAGAASLRRAAELFSGPKDLADLSATHVGLGMCAYYLCRFGDAREAFSTALALAQRMGDDSRASVSASNICTVEALRGDYDESIRYGLLSIRLGTRGVGQPNLVVSYTNLIDPYVLTGQTQNAVQCLEKAGEWVAKERRWKARIVFLCESASFALLTGNVRMALELTAQIERATAGRELAVPQPGLFFKLKAFRAAHETGHDEAFSIAAQAMSAFRGRCPALYLDAIAVTAWLERRFLGRCSPEIETELELFTAFGARGKRAQLEAQGFLLPPCPTG